MVKYSTRTCIRIPWYHGTKYPSTRCRRNRPSCCCCFTKFTYGRRDPDAFRRSRPAERPFHRALAGSIGPVRPALESDKAAVLKEIAAAGKEGPFTLTFSGAPLVGLGAPTVSSVHNQPLPPPKASKAAAAAPASAASVDPLDEARNLYSEPLERDGKRLVRLHVVPCFV